MTDSPPNSGQFLALINPRTIGTGRPNTGKALEVGIEAFQRVDRMAREAAAAKQASKEKLGSYTPTPGWRAMTPTIP